MKIGLRVASALTFLLLLPGVRAADPSAALSGTWKGGFEFEGRTMALTFHLMEADRTMTGTVEGLPTTPAEIHDGKIDGSSVSFWVNTDYRGQTYRLLCKGMVSAAGDEMAFTLATDDRSWSTELTAKKFAETSAAGADVTGDWRGAFDLNGRSVPLVFHFKSANGLVTGTVDGLQAMPTEIHDGKLDGNAVNFWLNVDYQGQTYKLLYQGRISAGQIAFTFGTGEGNWNTKLTATKSL
jgi:hypothetical protein